MAASPSSLTYLLGGGGKSVSTDGQTGARKAETTETKPPFKNLKRVFPQSTAHRKCFYTQVTVEMMVS